MPTELEYSNKVTLHQGAWQESAILVGSKKDKRQFFFTPAEKEKTEILFPFRLDRQRFGAVATLNEEWQRPMQ